MQQQIEKLVDDIVTDYLTWQYACANRRDRDISSVQKEMFEDFKNGISVSEGRKYIKIISNRGSVWGFIVNTDTDKKFRKGDILKPAGWNAPARNAARGNILDGGYCIQWTGPLYLK